MEENKTKIKVTEENLKELEATLPKEEQWQNLDISNDFMFAKVMRNPELCKGILERLMEIRIARIEYPETQKVVDISEDAKSVRLDVYVKDGRGTVYNVEMQAVDKKNLPKRSRYYQGMIDLNLIEKGADYNGLNKSFVIFICKFDLFGQDRHRYTFENLCREDTSLRLGDETIKLFFNTKGTLDDVSEETKHVLNFIENNAPEDTFTERLKEELKKIKENKEWEVDYMTLLMREREKFYEGVAVGEARGEARGKAEGIIRFTMTLDYSKEQIISALQESLKITEEQAEEYLAKYYENNTNL